MNITGIMIYYYFICKKKLWYFINQINMEQNSELVAIGKILDEDSYKKEKKEILIDNTINIDFIKNGAVLHEVKKTKSIEEAGIWQIKYYMYYLEKKEVKNIKAKIDYPLLRETKEIILSDSDRKVLDDVKIDKLNNLTEEKINEAIESILNTDFDINPKKVGMNNLGCNYCTYKDICFMTEKDLVNLKEHKNLDFLEEN